VKNIRWSASTVRFFAISGLVPVTGLPVATRFGHHVLKVVLVAIGVMFMVSLGAILVCKFTLPLDRGEGS